MRGGGVLLCVFVVSLWLIEIDSLHVEGKKDCIWVIWRRRLHPRQTTTSTTTIATVADTTATTMAAEEATTASTATEETTEAVAAGEPEETTPTDNQEQEETTTDLGRLRQLNNRNTRRQYRPK